MSELKTAVVMAGGEGVRLRPLTYVVPKPLLPVGPYTVIEHLVEHLAAQGVERVHVLAFYRYEAFDVCREYGERYGVEVSVHREPGKMGTFGGVAHIAPQLTEPFLIVNADLVLDADFRAMFASHVANDSAITIGTKRFTAAVPYGVVESGRDGTVLSITEKPSFDYTVSVGVNVVNPEVLGFLTGGRVDFPDVVEQVRKGGMRVGSYELDGTWLDVGQTEDYERAVDLLAGIGAEFSDESGTGGSSRV